MTPAIIPFALQASVGCPAYATLALALAAEFRPVDARAVEIALDDLAGEASAAARDTPSEQLETLALIAAGFRSRHAVVGLDDLLLDRVLARRRGHPVVIACVVAEAGRRGGIDVGLLGDSLDLLVALGAPDHDLVLDPANPPSRPMTPDERQRLRWRCSHQVAFMVLREVVDRSLQAGDVTAALQATDLRLALPLADGLRRRVEQERAALRARLN